MTFLQKRSARRTACGFLPLGAGSPDALTAGTAPSVRRGLLENRERPLQ
jgi:hypothetical protein